MLNDETNVSTSIESACLPIGCAVSAKYRGAFCSAQVKTVERQVKLKVTLSDTGDTIVISEEEIVQPVPLRIGNTVLIHTSNSAHTRNGLSNLVNSNENHSKQRGIIKQIYDNSIYTVVFNDGDEKSLRRSSLCLQGIRLYQTKIGQQKILEDIPTSSKISKDQNDITSIVAVRRRGNSNQNQQIFPALILNRKSLADHIWVKSFLDGREYIVHKHDDVESYQNNSRIQSLCRLTSKQATKACEKFIKYNQIPLIWQKKKKKQQHNEREEANDLHTSESDVDDSDEETSEEKDSFVAQLFAFMEDRGTPINNIPKVQNYDLDLHRLFKVVRMFGGYNKVTKNDQWNRVYMKMGLLDEPSPKNSRAIELAYKKYLFAYEDLSKKLGTMNVPNAYFGSRTSMTSDSRRSLVRVRQQSEEKRAMPIKQQIRKRLSVDLKPTFSSNKTQSTTSRRKTIIIKQSTNTSDSDSSDTESISINKKRTISNSKKNITDEKKKTNGTKNISSTSLNHSRASSAPIRKSKSISETESTLKPVIKIPKISYDILMEPTLINQKRSKKQTTKNHNNSSTDQSYKNKAQLESQINEIKSPKLQQSNSDPSNKDLSTHDLTPLPATPVSSSLSSSITDESPSNNPNPETSSITSESGILSSNDHKRSCDNQSIDEGLSPSKRARLSQDSIDKVNLCSPRLTYENISINDLLLVKCNLKHKKEHSGRCLEKNNDNKELLIRYQGFDSTYDEWIEIGRVIQHQNESLIHSHRTSIEENISNEPDTGIWKDLLTDDLPNSTNENRLSITSEINIEHILNTSDKDLFPTKDDILNRSSPTTSLSFELVTAVSAPSSPLDHRRSSIRRQKRRIFSTSKDSPNILKKHLRLDFDNNSNFNLDNISHSDNNSILNEQQSIENKRYRTVGKRNTKRTDNEMENSRANSPVNMTLRQQLEDMFKHRTSRYNFLDLNNNLTGDRRLAHLKDQMRQCQRVFFNLKHALTKIEKQRKIFLRRQKLSIVQPPTTDLFLPSTCT